MANEISTYKNNSKTISCSVPSGYTGYYLNFTINDNEAFDGTTILSITGVTITNLVGLITITKAQNDIDENVYFYQIDLTDGSYNYTIAKSSYTVLPSLTS